MPVYAQLLIFMFVVILIIFLGYLIVKKYAEAYSKKKQKEYIDYILNLLPNKNCGQCKNKTCEKFSFSILYKDEDKCPYLKEEDNKKINEYIDSIYRKLEDYSYYDKRNKDK